MSAGVGGAGPAVTLVGDDEQVPCVDGVDRRYVNLDAAASTGALPAVARRVQEFLPWYSSVHRGAGYKSQRATAAYEAARAAALSFAGRGPTGAPTGARSGAKSAARSGAGSGAGSGARSGGDDVAIICRNTTEAINHLAYRLRLEPTDVVVTTVVEHHANLLPWARLCRRRFVETGTDGTFEVGDVVAALDNGDRPRLLAVTGASNVTGWMPPVDELIAAAHERGVPVLVDGAQLAAHRPLPPEADFVAWSGHKMYAPFGAGVLIGPRASFSEGDPFLAGGGAVDLVDLDEVAWSAPPEREEAGSPNVIGAVALHAAIDELGRLGWDAITAHDRRLAAQLRSGLAGIEGVRLLGPAPGSETLPLATFTVEGVPHPLVAARLSAEYAVAVRHGCFCAHPYLLRLLGLDEALIRDYRRSVRAGDRSSMPGAVRASCGISTTVEDIDRLLSAVADIAAGKPAPVDYVQDTATGDFFPCRTPPGWEAPTPAGSPCAQG